MRFRLEVLTSPNIEIDLSVEQAYMKATQVVTLACDTRARLCNARAACSTDSIRARMQYECTRTLS